MATTLQLTTDLSKPIIVVKPSLEFASTPRHCRTSLSLPRFNNIARASSSSSDSSLVSRRHFVSETAALSLTLTTLPLFGSIQPAKSEESALSEWEKVSLPIDPGVVLLDIAFVPEDPKHGNFTSLHCSIYHLFFFLHFVVWFLRKIHELELTLGN